jgi:FeS assembly SUF system protein
MAIDMSEMTVNPLVLKNQIVDVLSSIYDPEIPVNIYELGLIYDLQVDPEGQVSVKMTLTTPHCPVAGSLPGEVQEKIKSVPGVKDVNLELVWDPPWDMGKMSEAAKLALGLL